MAQPQPAPLTDSQFGTAQRVQGLPVKPTYPFADNFHPAEHRVPNASSAVFCWRLFSFCQAVVSSLSGGAQLVIYWLASAINTLSRNDIFILDSTDTGGQCAYVRTDAVVIGYRDYTLQPNVANTQQLQPAIVRAQDNVKLSNGSIWRVLQPLVCVSTGQAAVLAQPEGVDGLPRRHRSSLPDEAPQGSALVLLPDTFSDVLPADKILGTVLVLTDIKAFRQLVRRGTGSIYLHRYTQHVSIDKRRRKPTGNLHRDCPPERITYKQANVVRSNLVAGVAAVMASGPLAARLEGTQLVASAVLGRMRESKPGAYAEATVHGFSAAQWQVIFGTMQPEQVENQVMRVVVPSNDESRWAQLATDIMVYGGWSGFPRKQLGGDEGPITGSYLEVEDNMVFDFSYTAHGCKLQVAFAYATVRAAAGTANQDNAIKDAEMSDAGSEMDEDDDKEAAPAEAAA